jgi:hypothetical protein
MIAFALLLGMMEEPAHGRDVNMYCFDAIQCGGSAWRLAPLGRVLVALFPSLLFSIWLYLK